MGDDETISVPDSWLGKDSEFLEFEESSEVRLDLLSKEKLIEKFDAGNYAVFAAMLFISAAIGVFFWWKGQKNTDEILMASKSMSTFPMTLSLVASFMSAITLLGTPAEMYVSGTQYVILAFCYPFVMAATAYIFLPVYSALDVRINPGPGTKMRSCQH